MAYTTSTDLKSYLGVSGAGDDTLLGSLIARAQKWIESYCGRVFEAAVDTTRYFTVGEDTVGSVLTLDEDLCQITSVKTNCDNGSGGVTLTVNVDYVTLPRNTTPYRRLKILGSSGNCWNYTSNPEMGVSVTGRWAFSVTAPADIVQQCVRWAAYMYKQKDAQVFDVTAMAESGMMTIPVGMPKDVRMALDLYRRVA